MKRGSKTKLNRFLKELRQKYKEASGRGHAITRRKIRIFLQAHKELLKDAA